MKIKMQNPHTTPHDTAYDTQTNCNTAVRVQLTYSMSHDAKVTHSAHRLSVSTFLSCPHPKGKSKQATQSKQHKRNRVLRFCYCSLACSPWLRLACFRMLATARALSRAQKLFWWRWSALLDAAAARALPLTLAAPRSRCRHVWQQHLLALRIGDGAEYAARRRTGPLRAALIQGGGPVRRVGCRLLSLPGPGACVQ